MPATYTFGTEHEFGTGAAGLVALMHANNELPDTTLHRYHCSCAYCCFEVGSYSFKANRDSSCDGEIVSRVFHTLDEALPKYDVLEKLSVDADAEPSLAAGLHVHIGNRHLRREQDMWARHIAFCILYEPLMVQLASGPWTQMRANNRLIAPELDGWYDEGSGTSVLGGYNTRNLRKRLRSALLDGKAPIGLLQWMQVVDRHCTINFSASTGATVEYRLWNATRMRWRMELAVRASMAFTDPEFYEHALRELDPTTGGSMEGYMSDFIELMGEYDPILGELADMQHKYTTESVADGRRLTSFSVPLSA